MQSPIRRASYGAFRPAAVQRRGRAPVGGPVPSLATPDRTQAVAARAFGPAPSAAPESRMEDLEIGQRAEIATVLVKKIW